MKLPIDEEKIIVKFLFTNRKWIPIGIRLVPRREGGIEAKHWNEGQRAGFRNGGLGAVRHNRVDTGKHQQFDNVDIGPTWERIKELFNLVDVHYFLQERSTGMKKPVVVVTFVDKKQEKGQRVAENIKKLLRILEQIERNFVYHGTWGIIHHWTNPDKGNITINCLKRQPELS